MNKESSAIKWGIMATGGIAHAMAQALHDTSGATMVAVASRTAERARAFADRWQIPRCYASYAELAQDPDVDVIYIATPHSEHYANLLLCLNAGKHVLCEKAFTLNATQAAECIALARERGLFLMEAMWMRFFPVMAQIRTWLKEGTLGDIRLVQADFCFNLPYNPAHRLYDPRLGGGALLDLGIYPLSFASMVLGRPQQIQGYAQRAATGVDELDTIVLAYPNNASATLTCSMRVYRPREAFIVGSKGYIKVHDIFFRPDHLTLHLQDEAARVLDFPFRSNGYVHEVEEVQACLRAGRRESQIMPLDETLALMQTMDALRDLWGVVYPGE